MEADETVLSDVHLYTDNWSDEEENEEEIKIVISRLEFSEPKQNGVRVDEDGDLLLIRPKIILIKHALSTPLIHVGLQIWNGALLLSDFILHKSRNWENEIIIELGSGTGLCSILLAKFAKNVFCTDTGKRILNLCEENVIRNDKLIGADGKIRVRELNWLDENPLKNWLKEDIENIFYLFASDVIYDDQLTDAFFQFVLRLTSGKCFCLYLSIEKRFNFCMDELEVVAHAYEHFSKWLGFFESEKNFFVEKMTNFDQFFNYERTDFLELWRICRCFCSNCLTKLN